MKLNPFKPALARLTPHGAPKPDAKPSLMGQNVMKGVWQAALTPRGLSLALSTSLADVVHMAPYALLPRLVPFCLTPGAQLALVGGHIGMTVVASPAMSLLSDWLQQRFTSQHAMALQDGWIAAAKNKANLWRNTELSQAAEQQMLDATREEASLVGQLIKHAIGSVVGLLTGLYGLRSFSMMTGASLGLIGLTSLLPIAAASLTQRYKTAAQAGAVEARQNMMQSVKGFWDNTTVGDTTRREQWITSHKRTAQRSYEQAWNVERINFLSGQFEQLPQTAVNYVMAASTFSSMHFPNARPLLSPKFLEQYSSTQAFMFSLSSSSFCLNLVRRLQQTAAIRGDILRRFDEPVDLKSQIRATELQIDKDGVDTCAQDLLNDPKILREPGLYTVRGANGAGKSTFLTHCRDMLGDDVLLVPAKHKLYFKLPHGSSGQMMMAMLNELDKEQPRPKVLMLDEWNAHLSRENEAAMLEKLRRWSQTTSVVQVTHHD